VVGEDPGEMSAGVAPVPLWPEVLSKPLREEANAEVEALAELLGRLELMPLDEMTAGIAAGLGARYGLRAADAVHLATAVSAGAERFITNNSSGFSNAIEEIAIVTPSELT